MNCYVLANTIQPCTPDELRDQPDGMCVAVMTGAEWESERERFCPETEALPDSESILTTQAESGYDYLTGTFRIPDRENIRDRDFRFAFVLSRQGMVFIDDSGRAEQIIEAIRQAKRWREPNMERFLYSFLCEIVDDDLSVMERDEHELIQIEDAIQSGRESGDMLRVNEIRGDMRTLLVHYEQLVDLTHELEENENGFFCEENMRCFRLLMNLLERYYRHAGSIRDHSAHVRELYDSQLEEQSNRTVSMLTIITAIFSPLTLIAGWYGMNFVNMPELKWKYGYPVVIAASVAIVVFCVILFKKKKWL